MSGVVGRTMWYSIVPQGYSSACACADFCSLLKKIMFAVLLSLDRGIPVIGTGS